MIDIPGGTTKFDITPRIAVQNVYDGPVTLTITYDGFREGNVDEIPLTGEITFHSVLEYRWREGDVEYEEHDEHKSDYEEGLILIQNSEYIESMLAHGTRRNYEIGQRFGGVIKEEDVKHYRLAFGDYGQFDIIALSVSVKTI